MFLELLLVWCFIVDVVIVLMMASFSSSIIANSGLCARCWIVLMRVDDVDGRPSWWVVIIDDVRLSIGVDARARVVAEYVDDDRSGGDAMVT